MVFGKRIIFTVLAAILGSSSVVHGQEVSDDEPAVPPVVETSPLHPPTAPADTGLASYYHVAFHGRRTASGETFNQNALTAAHRTLPFGTLVRVINLRNQRSVIVRVNDRGPYVHGRIVDVSYSAAETLGIVERGIANVKLDVIH